MCLYYIITWIKAWTGFYKDRFSPMAVKSAWSECRPRGLYRRQKVQLKTMPSVIHLKNERDKQEIKCIKLTQTEF